MKSTRNGDQLLINVEGSLGETSAFFTLPLNDVKEIIVDMKDMTYMNSIGVKKWILWTLKIPASCHVKLLNCPVMVVSQASAVVGFVTPNIKIESIYLPYACESCGHEELKLIKRGSEYEYATPGIAEKINLPTNQVCSKCGKDTLDYDVIVGKTFKFLQP